MIEKNKALVEVTISDWLELPEIEYPERSRL
jgi:hypothetical protein